MSLPKLFIATLGILGASLTTACTTNVTEGAASGALVGAGSAMFIGALTDLIVDGHVNPYRLERAAVRGAIAGGVAGGVRGNEKDRLEQAQATQSTNQTIEVRDEQELIAEIGSDNYQGLEALVACRHTDAFRLSLSGINSDSHQFKEAGYALQALIDKDRENESGADRAISEFLAIAEPEMDRETAYNELNILMDELRIERNVQGIPPQC